MPEKYVKIRDSLLAQGKSDSTAKRIAAATYNKQRKPGQVPVTSSYDLGTQLSAKVKRRE